MDYEFLIVSSASGLFAKIGSFIPTLLVALIILLVGCLLAHTIQRILDDFFKMLKIDMVFEKLGITAMFKTGGITQRPSKMVGSLIYIVLMFMVLMITVKAFGLPMGLAMFDVITAFIPQVIMGIVILIVGMLMAKFTAAIVYLVASNTDMPNPRILSRLAKLPVLVYVGVIYLREIGFLGLFEGVHYTIFMAGLVLTLALSFGLAGKTIAGKYLEFLNIKKD